MVFTFACSVPISSLSLILQTTHPKKDPPEVAFTRQAGCHRNVITLLDFEETEDGLVIVLERPTPSINLLHFLFDAGRISMKTAKFLFKQIVTAVAHCHARGVMHGDISCQNVLLELRTGRAVLIDFGSAAAFHSGSYVSFSGK